MFEILKSVFGSEKSESSVQMLFEADDLRLAEAALMVHVISVDGQVTEAELAKMKEILCSRLGLSEDEYQHLFEAAKKANSEAVDLYRFTATVKKQLDRNQRIEIIERLWEMVFADGKMHEFEDNVVWRAAQLLEVETQDRIAMKQRVRARSETLDGDD